MTGVTVRGLKAKSAQGCIFNQGGAKDSYQARSVLFLLRLTLLALIPASVYPQATTPRLPPAAEPRTGLVDETPGAKPIPSPEIDVSSPADLVPPGAEEILFTLHEIRLRGGVVYLKEELEVFYRKLIEQRISLAHVYQIARDIQKKYREDGFLLTRVVVPEQKATDGVFELRIVEGFIDSVRVEGGPEGLEARIKAYLNKVKRRGVRPVNRRELERYLLLINDLAGVTAKAVLRPAKGKNKEPGASELVLRVERQRYEGIGVINNRGSRFTGPWRAMLVGSANSVFDTGEKFEALFLTAFDGDEQRFGHVRYQQPFGSEGLTFNLITSYGRSIPGFTLDDLDVETETLLVGASLRYPSCVQSRRTLISSLGWILPIRISTFSAMISAVIGCASYTPRSTTNSPTSGVANL